MNATQPLTCRLGLDGTSPHWRVGKTPREHLKHEQFKATPRTRTQSTAGLVGTARRGRCGIEEGTGDRRCRTGSSRSYSFADHPHL